MSVNYGGTTTFRQPKSRGEGAIAYNKRMKDEYYARQMADVADFKARQRKIIDDKIAHEREIAIEKLKQTGMTNRQGITESGLNSRFRYTNNLADRTQKFNEFSAMTGLNKKGDEFGVSDKPQNPSSLMSRFNDYLSGRDSNMEAAISAFKAKNKDVPDNEIDFPQPMIDYMTRQSKLQQNPSSPKNVGRWTKVFDERTGVESWPTRRSGGDTVGIGGTTIKFDSKGNPINSPANQQSIGTIGPLSVNSKPIRKVTDTGVNKKTPRPTTNSAGDNDKIINWGALRRKLNANLERNRTGGYGPMGRL